MLKERVCNCKRNYFCKIFAKGLPALFKIHNNILENRIIFPTFLPCFQNQCNPNHTYYFVWPKLMPLYEATLMWPHFLGAKKIPHLSGSMCIKVKFNLKRQGKERLYSRSENKGHYYTLDDKGE